MGKVVFSAIVAYFVIFFGFAILCIAGGFWLVSAVVNYLNTH